MDPPLAVSGPARFLQQLNSNLNLQPGLFSLAPVSMATRENEECVWGGGLPSLCSDGQEGGYGKGLSVGHGNQNSPAETRGGRAHATV